jgi:inhibitor of cysteine peptidase
MFRELDELKKWLTGFFVIVLLTGGCSANEVRLNDAHDGIQKELTRDRVLFITLESNPTTGYSWQVAEIDQSILRQVGDAEYKSSATGNPPKVGAGGTETFRFETVSTGSTTLKLVYRRPWEKDVPPIKTYTVQISVR